MNEQIKLFAEQAGLQPYYDAQAEHIKKFAELIIRGCAMKANSTAIELRIYPDLNARTHVGDGILTCFGVEE